MIRGEGVGKNGRKVLILGLTRGNVENLIKGKPIFHAQAGPGFDHSLCIVFAETDADLQRALVNPALYDAEHSEKKGHA